MQDDIVDVQASLVKYNLIARRHNYYQVHGQCEMEKGSTSAPIVIGNKVVVFGVQQRSDVLEILIPRVETGDDVLYDICSRAQHVHIDELQHNLSASSSWNRGDDCVT